GGEGVDDLPPTEVTHGTGPVSPPDAAQVPGRPVGDGRSEWRRLAMPVAAAALAAGLIGGVIGAQFGDGSGGSSVTAPVAANRRGSSTTVAGPALDLQGILAKVEPAVVSIRVGGGRGGGAGTGVILSGDGEVLTNAHVVDGARSIRVILNGETQSREADLVGTDEANDLALLRIRGARGLPTAELGSSADLQVGDDVIAIGNALGLRGAPSVTRGIVSGLNRSLGSISDLIQTDAAINPGNSGGPLVNARGQVVGINTASAGARGGGAQNIGFAIPIDQARPIVERLRTGQGAAPLAFLGVSTIDLEDGSRGARITEVVAGSPAASAGLRPGDVITEVAGQPVEGAGELGGLVRRRQPGQELELTYQRGGDRREAKVILAERPSD
ncbi:MAG TPA: trypsin-like peptidase domain-containing protein, partial [Acidimicrobiales bacterium]|nr:trypsin-like peptidase domain-containing protein [Acidimicrobiales bacterium]